MKIIGITSSRFKIGDKTYLGQDRYYFDAIKAVGAMPVILPRYTKDDDVKRMLSQLDGIIFSGGTHIHPKYYDQASIFEDYDYDIKRDASEIAIAKQAIDMKLPILGICRGHQLIHVALGGSLYQDLSKELPDAIKHVNEDDYYNLFHKIDLDFESKFYSIMKKDSIVVNSIHSQAVSSLGEGLKSVAYSSDGLVEASEYSGQSLRSYQFHPEKLIEQNRSFLLLFDDFINSIDSDQPNKTILSQRLEEIRHEGMTHYLIDENLFYQETSKDCIFYTS